MTKLEEAKLILRELGMPFQQQSDLCALTFLSLASLGSDDEWSCASNEWIRIHEIIRFISANHGISYAENTREAIRKQALHHFRNAALIEDNNKATNSPLYSYRITEEALTLIRSFGSDTWDKHLSHFHTQHIKLIDLYASRKRMKMMDVNIDGSILHFSPGKHNDLQKQIIQEFTPRFAQDAICLYVGDTIKKDLLKSEAMLKKLGFKISVHDKMPDIVLYQEKTNWIYFIESVTSVGPMTPKRILEIQEMTDRVSAGKIYVTAFLDFKTYKRFAHDLAWETEVWIADNPDHLIHLNGDLFLGPRHS